MKIAIPYQNGQVFPHFGHAPQIKIYTIEIGMNIHTESFATAVSGDADKAVLALLAGKLVHDPTAVHCGHHDGEHHCGGHHCH